ncbi:DUF637 domain-containing protein [Candidatus Odyssella thessalonicensis]|uniref:DUF637 domain-containing protein n=1 Tax=Candidatus Odyssella thessalonicensis TaxID=84647 RepID=UPI000225BB41|nr:DUF637 domain-containing protein [Candidatus Odyssella thessalonicensis]
MFSFRKIVNVLVLVAYIKMTLVSSFAMDAGLPATAAKIKIQVDQKFNENSQLTALELRVLQKTSDTPSQEYTEVQSDTVDFPTFKGSSNVAPGFDGAQLIEWTIPHLGKIQVGVDGRLILDSVSFLLKNEILKIKTPGIVFLKDCVIPRLSLASHGSVIMGNNELYNVTAKHDASAGMITAGHSSNPFYNFNLKRGSFQNIGTLEFKTRHGWNLHGNAFINYNTLLIEKGADLDISNPVLFLNLNKISGNELIISTSICPLSPTPTPGRIILNKPYRFLQDQDFLATWTSINTLAKELKVTGLFKETLDLRELVLVPNSIVNMGQIDLQEAMLSSNVFLNHNNASFELHQTGGLFIEKLKNEGSLVLNDVQGDLTSKIQNLNNKGRFEAHTNLKIGKLQTQSSSQLTFYGDREVEIASPFDLYGNLEGRNGLNLTGTGQNYGAISLNQAAGSSTSPLLFNYKGGILENHGLISSLMAMLISGKGEIHNYKKIESPFLTINLPIIKNHKLINGEQILLKAKELDNSQGDIHAADKAEILVNSVTNVHGKVHAANTVLLKTAHLDNQGGSISGMESTTLHLQTPQFINTNGEIGAKGQTTLNFQEYTSIKALGTIKGTDVIFRDHSKSQHLTLTNGTVAAEKGIAVIGSKFHSHEVAFQTPWLGLHVLSFNLSPQAHCQRTGWWCSTGQDLDFLHEYRTTGTLEIWWSGIKLHGKAMAAMEQRFGDKTKPLPQPEQTIRFQATVQADKGLKIYVPQATVHFSTPADHKMTEVLLKDGLLDLLISKLDIESAVVQALNIKSWAPHGHFIGRLVEDPTHKVFASFHHSSGSHNLGRDINNVACNFLGKEITGVYDGRHLLTLPKAWGNGTSVNVKETTSFKGHMEQRGNLETQTLEIESDQDSICEASETKVEGDCTLTGSGNLLIQRYAGTVNFRYHAYWGCRNNGNPLTYNFVLSKPSLFRVQGAFSAPDGASVSVKASNLFYQKTLASINLHDVDMVSSLYSKFVDMTSAEGETYRQALIYNEQLAVTLLLAGGSARNAFTHNNCLLHALSFHGKTDRFKGSQAVYKSNLSEATGIVLSGTNTTIEGNVASPFMLIFVGNGKLALGSPNPYYIEPKNPIRDLIAKGFNFHTTYIAPDLREIIEKATKPQILFKMQERFWFDSDKAEQFYRDIFDHVVILTPEGIKKPDGHTIFSISPKMVVDRVREECQEVLMRGYIYDRQPIDEDFAKQLHRNASEYLMTSGLDPVQLSVALTTQNSKIIALPDKPLIYYTLSGNEEGLEQLNPKIFFPLALLEEARAQRGGKIRTNVLGIFPERMSAIEVIEYFQDQPQLQQAVLNIFEENPEIVQQINSRALTWHQTAKDTEKQVAVKEGSSSVTRQESEDEASSVTVYSTIRTKLLAFLSDSRITIHGDIEAENAFLASLYEHVVLQSLKTRVYTGPESFIESISSQARIHVKEILKIYGGQNVIMVSAQTHSGVLTHIKALADIIDVPLEVLTQYVENPRKKGKEARIQTNTSTALGSQHTSGGQVIEEAGNNIALQATYVEAPRIDLVAVKNVELHDAHNTFSRQVKSTEKGYLKKKKTHQGVEGTATSVGVHLKGEKINITALTGKITATHPTFEAIETNLTALQGMVEILLGVNQYFSQSSKSSSSLAWNRMRMRSQEDTTYAQPTFTGTVNIHSQQTVVQQVEGQANEFFQHIKQHGGALEIKFLKELHRSEHKMVQGPGKGLISLIALAMSILTAGAGTLIASGITSLAGNATAIAMLDVAVTSVATQLATGTLQNNGNPLKGAKTLLNKDYLKNFAVSVATAGATAQLGSHFNIKKPEASFVKTATNPELLKGHFQYNLLQQSVGAGVKSTLGGQSLRRNLVEGAKTTVIDTAAAYGANKAGQWYAQNELGYVGHKAMHFGIGFGLGYASSTGDRLRDGLTAGGGAVVAETTAEALGKAPGQGGGDNSSDDAKRLRHAASWGRFAAATAAFAAGLNVDAAIQGATNAVENNTLIFLNTRLLLEQMSELDPGLARELALSAEDEEALEYKYKEYEKEIQHLEKLLAKQELLEKARYQANQAGELMVNQQVLGLMMHNAVTGDLDTVDRLVQKSIDKASSFIRYFEEKSQFLIGLGCKLDDYAHRHPASAWMVDQAKQKLTKTIGYSQQLVQESAPLLRTASYSAFITKGMMYGFSTGAPAGGIGAIPGAALGGLGGLAAARMGELLYDYAHGQGDEFNDYAQQIARDDFELLQNRRVAKAMSGTTLLALDLLNVGRGKAKASSLGGAASKKYARKPTSSASASSRSIAEASQSQIAVERLVSQTTKSSSTPQAKVKTRGKGERQLTEKGRHTPVSLTVEELHKVQECTQARNKYLKKWREADLSDLPQETRRLISKTEEAVRKHLSPDDVAGVLKEDRGIVIMTPDRKIGELKPADHIKELNEASAGIKNRIEILREARSRLFQSPGTEKARKILEESIKDTSKLLDIYTKNIGKPDGG